LFHKRVRMPLLMRPRQAAKAYSLGRLFAFVEQCLERSILFTDK